MSSFDFYSLFLKSEINIRGDNWYHTLNIYIYFHEFKFHLAISKNLIFGCVAFIPHHQSARKSKYPPIRFHHAHLPGKNSNFR